MEDYEFYSEFSLYHGCHSLSFSLDGSLKISQSSIYQNIPYDNQNNSIIFANSVSEEINDADQNHELSHIGYYEIDHSQIANIKNEFINQGNSNINQFGFISNEEFVNMSHYNNNFSFASDNHLRNEQIKPKKKKNLVKANNKSFTELKPKNKQKKVKKISQGYYRKIINKYQYLKQFGNSYSSHSKSTTKGSSNNSNNNKSTISNNKNHLFISGPEEFVELLNDLNFSADNPYYKRKKKKIIKKVKNKVKNKLKKRRK